MDNLYDQLRRFRDDEPELTRVLDGYRESRRAYREALEARRVADPRVPGAIDSAQVTVSARPTVSLSEYTIPAAGHRKSSRTV